MQNNFLSFGSIEPLPVQKQFRADRLAMAYESGNIRYIKFNGIEVIRMIYSAVRDENWLTIEPVISNEKFVVAANSFDITYDCSYKKGEIDFSAQYKLTGQDNGTFSFEMNGIANADFKKNRIGFCVLHPINEYAGKPVTIEHPDGSHTNSEFPQLISPHQPFMNIQCMKAYFSKSNYTVLNFTGEVFETEDQRNWTDGSFKTYCTPLGNPKPVKVKKGETIYQKVELKVEGPIVELNEPDETNTISLNLDVEKTVPLPQVGICRSTRKTALSHDEIETLKTIPFDGYRTEVYFSKPNWKHELELATNEAKLLEYRLEYALILKNGAISDINEFVICCKKMAISPASVYLLGADCHCLNIEFVNAATAIIKKEMTQCKVGCGTNANFAQLNRQRPVGAACDFVSFAIHPQEHAFDNLSLVENAEAQKYAVESALVFSEGKPIAVSPVTLRRRFNANIEFYESELRAEETPVQVDSRQATLFAASWTLASLKYLALAGASKITYFETVGERGIMMGNYAPEVIAAEYIKKNTFFPLFALFKFILNLPQPYIYNVSSTEPLKTDAFGIQTGSTNYSIVFNFTHLVQHIKFTNTIDPSSYLQIDAEFCAQHIFNSKWIEADRFISCKFANNLEIAPNAIIIIRQNRN